MRQGSISLQHSGKKTPLGLHVTVLAAISALLWFFVPQVTGAPTASSASVLTLEGAIGPATAGYVESEIEHAERTGAGLVLLRIDTPGGLDQSMRDIVKSILGARVPVVGYVAPSGARAASAGTYILYATHIAAMAPATNLGAATPVQIGGGSAPAPEEDPSDEETSQPDSGQDMRRKAVNDAVAYIRGLAERRGRNADWAETAVREGASLSASAALEQNVIDLMADNAEDLLAAIDGRTVVTAGGEVTLETEAMQMQARDPDWRMRLLAVITNPTVAYILMMIGIYGLILEGFNPGALVPGVVGAVSLLIALFAFQILPVNYAGLALLALGIGLMVAEGFAPSFGILGLGGVAAFVVGSIILMDTDVPGYEIPVAMIGATATASALLMFLIVALFMRSRGRKVVSGHEGLVGATGEALADFEARGRIFVHGENWQAVTRSPVRRGQHVRVLGVDGLTVTVEPIDGPKASHSTSIGETRP